MIDRVGEGEEELVRTLKVWVWGIILISGITHAAVDNTLIAEYRLDECSYDGGQPYDVIDNSLNRLHGLTVNGVTKTATSNKLCTGASFNGTDQYIEVADNAKLNISGDMSVSFWIYPTRGVQQDEYYVAKYDGMDGWRIWFNHRNNNPDRLQFNLKLDTKNRRVSIRKSNIVNWFNNWHFITAVYDGSNGMSIYLKDNVGNDLSNSNSRIGNVQVSTTSLVMAIRQDKNNRYFQGSIDEVKIWSRALSAQEITDIYNNESAGRNWDNTDGTTTRVCRTCQCTAKAGSNMISFASDFRNMSDTSIAAVISGDLAANYTYGTSPADWQMAGRTYDISVDNNAFYDVLADTTRTLGFGQGYWLVNRTQNDIVYTANTRPVDFNATIANYPSCQSANGKCVLVDLVEPNGTNNNGPYIYTLTSLPVSVPIRWEKIRVLIDGTSYPVDSAPARTLNSTIWRYDQNGNSYTNVTPNTPGTVQTIDPCYGYWVELAEQAAGKDVKLLIPEE